MESNMKLYADDATVYINYTDANIAHDVISKDLKYIESWADQWLVKFSATKTKAMNVSFKQEQVGIPPFVFNNTALEKVKKHKHLGITITSNLSWASHIDELLNHVSLMADVMRKLKYQIDRKSLETIYFSFMRPKLEYACHIWDNCSGKDADLLENFQLDVARIVCGARKGTSHDAISEELGWESLKTRRLASKDKHFIKICNKSATQYLCELLPTTVGEHSQRSLRNENDLKEMKGRTETFRGSFIPDAIKRYNYNQKGNVINRNDDIVVEMNRKLFEYGNRATAVKHAQLRMKCSLLSGHLYDLHVVDSPACQCGFDFEDINHFFFNCPLFGAERTELLTNLLTLGITDVNLSLLLIGCDDYDEELNKNVFKFVHHFIDSTGRL